MVPNIKSGLVDMLSFFPQSVRDIKRLASGAERLVRSEVRSVIEQRERRRHFGTIILPIDRVLGRVGSTAAILELLMLVHPDATMREAAAEGLMSVKKVVLDELSTNRELYRAVKDYAVSSARQEDALTEDQELYLTDLLRDFEKSGLALPDDQLVAARDLGQRIMVSEIQFDKNISCDVRTIEVDPTGLEGLDEVFVAALNRTEKGTCILRVDMPTVQRILQYCTVSATREAMWLAYNNRAYPTNISVLEELIALRDRQAQLLGFKSYAHLNIDGQMAKDPETVEAFLADLGLRSQHKRDAEMRMFRDDLPADVTLTQEGLFKPWDIAYVIESHKRKKFDIDMQKVREYFPVKRTLDELLAIYEHFLGLEFRQEETVGLWHNEVKHLIVYKKNGERLGDLLLDLYPRDNKYTHACQISLLPGAIDEAGVRCPAVVAILANFPRPRGDDPGLLQLSEVSTFFHEFGHAMHTLLGATRMIGFSGPNGVKLDFVEVPSQMFEEWLNEPEVLKRVSCHYKTGEPLSDAVIERLCRLRSFCSGGFVQGQLSYTQLALRCFAPGEKKDLDGIKKALHKEFSRGIMYDDRAHSICAFGHLTQYGARYYSYLWSQIFAYDLFAKIKESGLFDRAVGERLIETILGRGGSREPKYLLQDFLGREPNIDAFLRRLDL